MEHLDVQLARELLKAQLAPADQARWMSHVDHCPRCRELLTAERALLTVLHFDDPPPPVTTPDVDRVLERVSDGLRAAGSRLRRRAWLAGGEALLAGVLAALLVWQVVRVPTAAQRVATELRVSAELQSKVVQHLNALRTLEAEPWLVDHFETVRALDVRIGARQTEQR